MDLRDEAYSLIEDLLKSDIYSILLRHVNTWIDYDYVMISFEGI